jgi:RHS repeat-associated protein
VHDLAGRVVAVDEYGDGASWAAMNSTTGHSTDDDVDLARLAELTGELFAYEYDLDNDFLPERGADVLFGYDSAYVVDSGLCRTAPNLEQAYLLGRISWVRDASGCSWSSYDERGRSTWSARQLDPGEQVFVTAASYDGVAGPDDLDRLRSETYPDGTSVHYDFSQRGLLKSVTGQAPNADSLFAGRTFADDIRHDEFGQRTSWLLGDSSGNQVRTDYQYNVRRRLESMTSQLSGPDGTDMALARNRYYYDQVGNVRSLADNRTLAETADWSPEPVSYRYTYDSLYRLTRATPWYRSVPRLGFAGLGSWWLKALKRRVGRAGDQEWSHDALGSMRTWTAENWGDGDHFYEWGLGTIINGQQLIAADAGTGVSSRCATVPEAAARVSGPAPHALYFAYEAKESDGEYNGLEACYDAAGNMVALYRLNLAECGAEPLSEATADWNCASQTVVWDLQLLWDAAGRLSRVEKLGDEGVTDIRHVYDATGTRALRLDHESTEGSEQATLFLSPAYEIRDATVDTDGSYYGGEETKYVFAGDQRIARVVEQVADGVAEWPNAPGRAHVFHTLTNHLGSASVTFDGESIPGQNPVVVAQTQLAYGAEDDRVDNPVYGGWRPNYEFTGKEEDPDVGLMYFGARFYGAGMGRFISADPLAVHGLGADLNQYRYVRANPLLLVDPSGLDGEQSNVITSMPDGASCPETNPSGSEAGQLPIHRYDGEWNLQSTNPEHTCLYGEGGQFYGDNVDFTSDPIERVAGSAPEGGGILGSVAEALNPVTPMISPVIRSQYGIPADSGASWGLQGMDALERSASMVAQRGATASEGAAFWFDRVTTVASFAAEAALGSIGASGLARGGGAGVRLATRGGGKMRVPWKFGSPSGGARGSTDAYGNITIRRGLSGRELTETVRHEAVHRFFSPTRPGRFQVARARLGMWGYKNSAFLKYTEEALAEGIATRSVSQGLLFPITHGYVHPARLAIETGALGGAGYGLYSLHK